MSALLTAVVARAVSEVARPIAFAICTIVIVFAPVFTLEQMEGKMFKPLALTMCFAIASSLLVAFTAMPVLSSFAFGGGLRRSENFLLHWTTRGYLAVLRKAITHRRVTLVVSLLCLGGALALLRHVGTEFLPPLDEGAIAVNVVRLPSAGLTGSVAVGTEIERRLLAFPEVETVVTKTGRAEIAEDPMGPEQNDVFVILKPRSKWRTGRTKAQLIAAMEGELRKIPGIRFSFSQPIALRVNELISGIKSDLAIKIFGPDLAQLRTAANRVAAAIDRIKGARDVWVQQTAGFSQIEVVINRKQAARYRINVSAINDIIEAAVGGKVATEVIEGQRRFAVLLRFPFQYRKDIEAIRSALLPTPEGLRVRLDRLATVREVQAPYLISREGARRRAVVECNIRGRDTGSFVAEVKRRLAPLVASLPEGYEVAYGGEFENQKRAMDRLSVVVPVAVGLIFLMLFSAFNSMKSALLVMTNLPFSLIGAVAAIVLLKMNLSVSAAIGLVALFGVAVQNGTVLMAFVNRLRAEGKPAVQAVIEACSLRFAPILMTTLTTLLGLTPMLYATGSGSEIQAPLAAVVMGGLASALAMVLLVLPALYTLVEKDPPRSSQIPGTS